MTNLLLKYMNLPSNISEDFEKPLSDSDKKIINTSEYPAYTKHFGQVAQHCSNVFGVSGVYGVDFADYYLSAMESRSTAKVSFPPGSKFVFIYNVGDEPVERKDLAASLLKYLLKKIDNSGRKAVIVSDQGSGIIERSYGVKIKSRINF